MKYYAGGVDDPRQTCLTFSQHIRLHPPDCFGK
jgi:hypothetical protein